MCQTQFFDGFQSANIPPQLENDLLSQIVPSIRVRFEQALMQKDPPKVK